MKVASLSGIALILLSGIAEAAPYRIGSKRFTESIIVAEIGARAVREAGGEVTHVEGLGGTAIVFRALEEGSIDAYPEYLGSLTEAILKEPGLDWTGARDRLRTRGLDLSPPLGFENGYAIAVPEDRPATSAVRRIGDLAKHPELRLGISHELLARSDGWPRLRERYGLGALTPRGLDHGLAYAALAASEIDVLDVYTTDASLARYRLRLLEDTEHAFPSYEAIWVFRHPETADQTRAVTALSALRFTREEMVADNDAFERKGQSARAIAAARGSSSQANSAPKSFLAGTLEVVRTEGPRHVELVFSSLLLAILFGVPLGLVAERRPRLGGVVLAVTALLQTIPALALLCFFVPLFGIGRTPTIAALFLYGLLPIVRNTLLGFRGISRELRDSARAMGLPARATLFSVELPLALPSILAGVRTAAVLDVGTATVAAFVGAGGFGQAISEGLSVNDTRLIVEGALPAALLALIVELFFAGLERVIVPAALRRATSR